MVISTGAYGLDENTKVKIGTDPNAKPDDDDKPAAGAPDAPAKEERTRTTSEPACVLSIVRRSRESLRSGFRGCRTRSSS